MRIIHRSTARARALRGVGLAAIATAIGATGVFAQTDEIVVNAQKRERSLQDLPVSGTVVTEEEIQDFGGFTSDLELGQFLTGVEVEDTGNTEYFIRGANSDATGPLSRSGVTQLLNGAEVAGGFAGRSFERMDTFDIREVAVFRGPQGALYGRGAIGGVINQVSNRPKNFFEYRTTQSWGVTDDEARFDGIINIPIIKNRLLFRGGIAYQENDGYLRNDFRDEGLNGFEFVGGRTSFRYFFNEDIDATLIVDYGEASYDRLLHSSIAATLPGERFNVFAVPVDPDGNPIPLGPPTAMGSVGTVGFPGAAPGDPFHQAIDSETFYEENTFTGNLTVNFDLPIGVGTSITGLRSRAYEVLLDDDLSYVGGVARVAGARCQPFVGTINTGTVGTTDLGAFGYMAGNVVVDPITLMATMVINSVAIPAADVANDGRCESSRWADTSIITQEFRLQSPETGRLTWLVGTDGRLAYQNQSFERFNSQPSLTTLSSATNFGTLALSPQDFREDNDVVESHVALFGNVGYNPLSWLNLSASARYTYERVATQVEVRDRDVFRGLANMTIPGAGVPGTLIYNPGFNEVIIAREDEAVYQSIIPSLTVTARAPGEWIYFASWGQGFKPGGFNAIEGTAAGSMAPIPRKYNEEWANTYELGLKKTFRMSDGNFRFSLIGYRVDYNDRLASTTITAFGDDEDPPLPGEEFDIQNTFGTQGLFNAGDGYSQGLEFDFGGQARDPFGLGGVFNYGAGATFNESRTTGYHAPPSTPGSNVFTLDGQQYSFLSTWTLRGNFTYRRPLPFLENSGLGLFLNSNFSWRDDTDDCQGFINVTLGTTGCSTRGADIYSVWNLRGGIEGETRGQGWSLTAFWDNWNDRSYERSRPAIGGVQAFAEVEPSSWGIRLTIAGDER